MWEREIWRKIERDREKRLIKRDSNTEYVIERERVIEVLLAIEKLWECEKGKKCA